MKGRQLKHIKDDTRWCPPVKCLLVSAHPYQIEIHDDICIMNFSEILCLKHALPNYTIWKIWYGYEQIRMLNHWQSSHWNGAFHHHVELPIAYSCFLFSFQLFDLFWGSENQEIMNSLAKYRGGPVGFWWFLGTKSRNQGGTCSPTMDLEMS